MIHSSGAAVANNAIINKIILVDRNTDNITAARRATSQTRYDDDMLMAFNITKFQTRVNNCSDTNK